MATGIIASSLATLRPLIFGSSKDDSKLSGTLSSFGSSPRRQPNSSGMRTDQSMHSLAEAEARYGIKKQFAQQENSSQGELVRDEVIFSPDATHGNFLMDESDHEAQWRQVNARQPKIQEAELAHIKNGADMYHPWKS